VFGHRQYLGLIEVAEMVYLIYFLGCGSYFVWVCGPICSCHYLVSGLLFSFLWFVVPFRVCCLGLQKRSIFLTLFVVVNGS